MASDREPSRSGLAGVVVDRRTNLPGSRIGSGRKIRAFCKLNMAVFAPIPNERERIATAFRTRPFAISSWGNFVFERVIRLLALEQLKIIWRSAVNIIWRAWPPPPTALLAGPRAD